MSAVVSFRGFPRGYSIGPLLTEELGFVRVREIRNPDGVCLGTGFVEFKSVDHAQLCVDRWDTCKVNGAEGCVRFEVCEYLGADDIFDDVTTEDTIQPVESPPVVEKRERRMNTSAEELNIFTLRPRRLSKCQ